MPPLQLESRTPRLGVQLESPVAKFTLSLPRALGGRGEREREREREREPESFIRKERQSVVYWYSM